jgi:integrase
LNSGSIRPPHPRSRTPPIRLHDLWDGTATQALAACVDHKVVQDMLGHASIVQTADTSVLPETARQAAADSAALIRDADRLVPGTTRPRHREYPRRPEPEPEDFPEAA